MYKPTNIIDNMQTADGRKVVNVSTNELSVGLETTEQAANGRKANAVAEEEELKLEAIKRGCVAFKPW